MCSIIKAVLGSMVQWMLHVCMCHTMFTHQTLDADLSIAYIGFFILRLLPQES